MESKKHELIKLILQNDVFASMICHGICLSLTNTEQIKDCLISTSNI
jgi:hypothetical protein